MSTQIFSDTACTLGEGALWHPDRNELFWFDILGKRLFARGDQGQRHWQFDEHVSAAGLVGRDTLLIASETALSLFDLTARKLTPIVALEADNPVTRSNDGRADPWGGFWIGTMGKKAEVGAGSLYRLYRGELRKLRGDLTITNAICFAPDRSTVYFADTARKTIWRQMLDTDGWPVDAASVFLDLTAEGLNPDGAVTDSEGCVWNAQWGASRVARYDPDGQFLGAVDFPATQTSCPAFGGPDLTTLFVTTAAEGLGGADSTAGKTYRADITDGVRGLAEPRVILG